MSMFYLYLEIFKNLDRMFTMVEDYSRKLRYIWCYKNGLVLTSKRINFE